MTCIVGLAHNGAVTIGADSAGADGYAMGAMHARADLAPRKRLQAGLDAAATFSAGVAGPFNFIELEAWSPKKA